MTEQKDTPFFPTTELDHVSGYMIAHHPGVTLRQWYAGLAMQAYISGVRANTSPEYAAAMAFRHADAMIKEEAKT